MEALRTETVASNETEIDTDSLKGVLQWLLPKYSRDGIQVPRDPDSDDLVRPLLDAGVDALVERFITYQDSGVEAYTSANEVLGVPLATVMGHFAARLGTYPAGKKAHRDRITNRWKTASRYQRDLLRYVFRLNLDRQRLQNTRVAVAQMLELPFGALVSALAESETDLVSQDPVIRLRLALQAAFPNDPEILSLAGKAYRFSAQSWAGIIRTIIEAYGIDFGPRSADDMAYMFNVVVLGAYLRRNTDPTLGMLSDMSHISVQMVQMLLSQMAGQPWNQLAERTSIRAAAAEQNGQDAR